MTDHEAFERALLADPEDDTIRLAFADFVEERGERHKAKYLREIRRTKFVRRVRQMGAHALAPYPDLPPKVKVHYDFWAEKPPQLSPRCVALCAKLRAGWQVPSHIYQWGYDSRSEAYGVWIWELRNVIDPLIREIEEQRAQEEVQEEAQEDDRPGNT